MSSNIHSDTAARRKFRHRSVCCQTLLAAGLSWAQMVRHLTSTLRIKELGAGLEIRTQLSLLILLLVSGRGTQLQPRQPSTPHPFLPPAKGTCWQGAPG